MSYSTEESQWLMINGTIRKLRSLRLWMDSWGEPRKHVEEAILDLEKAKEILEKKLDK